MHKQSLEIGWKKLSPKERQDKIDEIEKWLLYRDSGKWFENIATALLQEIYHLREINQNLKSRDP